MGIETIFACDRCNSRSNGRKEGWWRVSNHGYKLEVSALKSSGQCGPMPGDSTQYLAICGIACAVGEVGDWLRARSGGSTPESQ